MTRTQQVIYPDGSKGLTVIGDDFLPIRPVRDYLEFLRLDGASPHTQRSYAAALALWWQFLDLADYQWHEFPTKAMGEFMAWLRTGDSPGTARIGAARLLRKPATIGLRAAAVHSFYRYRSAAYGETAGVERLYSTVGRPRRNSYTGFLTGVGGRHHGSGASPVFRARSGPDTRTPLLRPDQVRTIIDSCALETSPGMWSGSVAGLRNRLFFASLAETGMRLGEALNLRHHDVHITAGDQPYFDVTPGDAHPHLARVKSGRSRRIYIGDDLASLYSAYVWELVDVQIDLVIHDLADHFVFVNGPSAPSPFAALSPETIYAVVRQIRRDHPVLPQDWSPHWMRHTHATALLLSGCPPHVVMRRLGHQDIQTTLSTYGWVTEDAELRSLADWQHYAEGWQKELVR